MGSMPTPTIAPVSYAEADQAVTDVLLALVGPGAAAKPDQLEAVRAVVADRRRTLVVQATGWGKSLVYQAAALASRRAGGGPALVVSPLLALMRDQVDAATRAGLTAVTLNSANIDDWQSVEAQLLADQVDLLLVSPERLANPRFGATVLQVLLPRLGLLVVDEAHCISDWGFDFRPDYQRLTRVMAARPDLPVLATTATANQRVTDDVAAQLGADTVVLRGPLARASLTLAVVPGLTALQRYAWVAQALPTLAGSGIVYTLTVAEAERLAAFLSSTGLEVAAYTGRMETGDRERVEDRLRTNAVKAVVATSALGMGYDKPDLGFVIHVGSPASPVAYYQQVGRAGRALDHAVAVLLPAESDEAVWDYFATANTPTEPAARALLEALAGSDAALSVPALEQATGLRRSKVEGLLKVLAVDGATARVGAGWLATGESWEFDGPKYARLVAGRRAEADLMRSYAHGAGCLMGFLRTALDDVTVDGEATGCGRCSVCAGTLPEGLTSLADPTLVEAARVFCRGQDVVIDARQMWPAGLPERRGRIGLDRMPAPGRALAFADDPGWADVLGSLVAEGAPDALVPDDVLAGLVEVLARWSKVWGTRPVAVVPVPSRRRPLLVADLARRIGEAGRLPVVDLLRVTGAAPGQGLASRARVEVLLAGLSVDPDVGVPAAPVLLVDDYSASGWTLTVAAALLRDAGAEAVFPLVLHRRPG